MFEKRTGFSVRAATRQRLVDPKAPGQVFEYSVILLVDSLVKAFQEAVQQCPSDRTLISLSISEVPVLAQFPDWTQAKIKNKEKKDDE